MRRPTIGRNRSKQGGRDKQALLANSSPSRSPSVWGVQDDVGLFPIGAPSTNGPTVTIPVRSPSPSNSALSERNRFHPQYEPRKGQSAEDMIGTAALQFVPAYEEATTHLIKVSAPARTSSSHSPTKRLKPKGQPLLVPQHENSSVVEQPTWDAIIEADDSSLRSKSSKGSWRSRKKSKRGKSLDSLSSAEEKKSSPSAFRNGQRRGGTVVGISGPPKIISSGSVVSVHNDETTAVSSASRQKPRIARLASMFGSRTINKTDQSKNVGYGTTKAAAMQQRVSESGTSRIPSSPARSHGSSSSSAGFVAWPGTQNKQGKVVDMESSYDDSSVGAAAFRDSAPIGGEVLPWTKAVHHGLELNESDAVESDAGTKSAADVHLEAILYDAKIVPQSNWRATQTGPRTSGLSRATGTEFGGSHFKGSARSTTARSQNGAYSVAGTTASSTLSIHNLFPENTMREAFGRDDPWDVDSSSQHLSSPGTSVSKDSSAFFHMDNAIANGISSSFPNSDSQYGVRTNVIGAASIIRRKQSVLQPPTERALEVQNQLIPPPRSFAAGGRGFRGYLDKTQDVPSLMDAEPDDSDSVTSSKAPSVTPERPPRSSAVINRLAAHVARTKPVVSSSDLDDDSDVFDNISKYGIPSISSADIKNQTAFSQPNEPISRFGITLKSNYVKNSATSQQSRESRKLAAENADELNVITLRGGLRVIQTTQEDFELRRRPTDFDENLSSSEVDQYGFVKTPGFSEMLTAGRSPFDSAKYDPHRESLRDDRRQHQNPAKTYKLNERVHIGLEPDAIKFVVPTDLKSGVGSSKGSHKLQRLTLSHADVFDYTTSDIGSADMSSDFFGGRIGLISNRGDFSKYRVRPGVSKELVRAYRDVCREINTRKLLPESLQKFEDGKKSFALSEMRSRIMEKDLERGLERQGGSVPVDDIVLTPFYQASQRVRDAVIVSKAWRDGASPSDVIASMNMTRRAERSYAVKRRMKPCHSPSRSHPSDSMSISSDFSQSGSHNSYYLEAVSWMDDTDFMQMRCASLGPRTMRGFEMFSIGDCQSILLKLTNERCIQLRSELNEATKRQIDAEEMMKDEGDYADGMMTESEMRYLTAMEDVKTISKRLVLAEKSFCLVRERIEKLVARYEAILVKMENESIATASVITYESSSCSNEYDSDGSYTDEEDVHERESLQRRAQRAELRAELAAREAILAKQEAQKVREEKQREIEVLQLKLAELQSESSYAIPDRERSIALAKTIARKHRTESRGSQNGHSVVSSPAASTNSVKQKFRERLAERTNSRSSTHPGSYPSEDNVTKHATKPTGSQAQRPALRMTTPRSYRRMLVGEEMFQHLDFYERSLKAVDPSH